MTPLIYFQGGKYHTYVFPRSISEGDYLIE